MLKSIASHLPRNARDELKRWLFRRQIRRGSFISDEPEFAIVQQLLNSGDIAIDVGANIGHYTVQLARCVGPSGRVIAFEPMPETFELLTANVRAAGAFNVTLLNLAASSQSAMVSMSLPKWPDGHGENFYMAKIASDGEYRVMCASIDAFQLPQVRLIKIDAEGHDLSVLEGAKNLIERDHPTIIVELTVREEIQRWLEQRGYNLSYKPNSPNLIATYSS